MKIDTKRINETRVRVRLTHAELKTLVACELAKSAGLSHPSLSDSRQRPEPGVPVAEVIFGTETAGSPAYNVGPDVVVTFTIVNEQSET